MEQLEVAVVKHLPKKIAVGWSGGADSTALLLLLQEAGHEVQAWHIDHGWHQDSFAVAQSLAEQANALGIAFHMKQLTRPLKNMESAARLGRYHAFAQLAKEQGCDDLALAHHAGDQAETVCMRLLQGSGVAGCQGMKAYREHKGVRLWRPLLLVSRHVLESMLEARKLQWFDDPSNQDTSLWRNKIRRRLFPTIAAAGVDPQTLFLRWQAQAEKLYHQISLLAKAVTIDKHVGYQDVYCTISWQQWCLQAAPVRAYLLQQMIARLFTDGTVFGRRHILAIEQWREHGGNGWLNLSGCCLYRREQGLQLCQGKASFRKSSLIVMDKG